MFGRYSAACDMLMLALRLSLDRLIAGLGCASYAPNELIFSLPRAI